MKKSIYSIILLLLAVVFGSCTSKSDGSSYVIAGNVDGFADGTIIDLIPISHDKMEPLVEAVVTNSTFEFRGSVDQPTAVFLKARDGYGQLYLMVENKQISIEGEVKSSTPHQNKVYDFSEVTIKGSPLTDLYHEKISIRDKMDELYQAMTLKYQDVTNKVIQARRDNDMAAIDSISQTEEYIAMSEAEMDFFRTVETSYENLIISNKDTYWGPLLMVTLLTHFSDDQKPWYDSLSEEAKNSYYGKMVHDELYPVGLVGTAAPKFDVKDQNGVALSLGDLIKDKKYTLIDFWASWCSPCIKEIPNLKNLYSKYSDKGFEIISISIDEKEDDWTKKSKEVELPWPSFLDKETIAAQYKVKVVPTMYILDSNGVIIAENLRGSALDEKLEELFLD